MTDRIAEIRACLPERLCTCRPNTHEDIATLLAAIDDRDRELERLRAIVRQSADALESAEAQRRAYRDERDAAARELAGHKRWVSLPKLAAYYAWAEAMRERCIAACMMDNGETCERCGVCEDAIRSAPIPETKR
jgi:hypothetical protein